MYLYVVQHMVRLASLSNREWNENNIKTNQTWFNSNQFWKYKNELNTTPEFQINQLINMKESGVRTVESRWKSLELRISCFRLVLLYDCYIYGAFVVQIDLQFFILNQKIFIFQNFLENDFDTYQSIKNKKQNLFIYIYTLI